MDFITAAECATFLSVTSDATLTRLVSAVERDFMTACGRSFERGTFTSYLAGYDLDYTFVPEWPIHSITEVRIDPSGELGEDTALDAESLAKIVYSDGDGPKITYVGGYFPRGSRVARITYEAGWYPYSDTDEAHATGRPPEDIRDKLIEEVVARYRRGPNEQMQSENIGGIGGFSRFAPGPTQAFRAAVRRYRRVV